MMALGLIEIIIALIVGLGFLLVVVCGVLLAWRLLRGQSIRCSRQTQANEARMIQEIHQGLSKMEQRVETLETILLDRVRPEHRENAEI